MGNQQSFQSPQTHSRFSKVQYSTSHQSMIVREPLASRTKGINTWLEKRKLHQHVYNLPSIFACQDYNIEANGSCSDTGMFFGKYEGAFEKTLKQEIGLRAINTRYFTEEEIWYFILFISKAAHVIYQYGENHVIGNLHPFNILINRKGDYKIIVTNYSFSLPNQLDHFREYQINGDSQAFISPELIGFLYSTKYAQYPFFPKCVNKQAAEAFSLGVTIISMATLNQQMAKIYKRYNCQYKVKRVNTGRLKNSLELTKENSFGKSQSLTQSERSDYLSDFLGQIKKRYSNVLYELIVGLTYTDPEIRVRIDRVYNELIKPIERNILLFDNRWIKQLKQPNESALNQHHSIEICQKWVRRQSYILKQLK